MIYAMGLAGLGLAWLVPGHYFPWFSFEQEVLSALGAGLVGVATLVSTEKGKLLFPRLSMAIALLALVPLIQWFTGMFPYAVDAVLPALYLLAFAMTVIASASVYEAKGATFAAWLFGSVLVAAIASTGLALLQWLRIGTFDWVEPISARIHANLAQPNHFASLLGLGLAGTLWFYETRRIGSLVALLTIAFLGLGLVMAQSRTGWLAVVAIVAWVVSMKGRLRLRTTCAVAFGALAAFAAVLTLWQPLNELLHLSAPQSIASRLQDSIRPIMWASLLDAVGRAPWFGYGWGQVAIAQQVAALDYPAAHSGWAGYSHNILIDLLVWNGIPLGLLVFGATLYWLVSRTRACKDKTSWVSLVGSTVLFIHAMVEFPHAYLYFLLPLALMAGTIETQYSKQTSALRALHLPRLAFGACLMALASMLAWILVEYDALRESARRVSLKEAGYAAYTQAPFVPNLVLLDGQREFIRLLMTDATPGMAPAQLDWMRTATQHFAPPTAMLRLALAAGLNHREAEAEKTLRLLCKIARRRHCDEARASWAAAQQEFEALRGIPFPATEVPSASPADLTKR
jgi:O-antigen ligase